MSTKPKWPPGPWRLQRVGDSYHVWQVPGGWFMEINAGYQFAYFPEPTEVEAEFKACARLFVAAPDLHAALAKFVKQWEACGPNSEFGRYFGNVYHESRAAIAKAERNTS